MSALEHNVRHHDECAHTFQGAAVTAKGDGSTLLRTLSLHSVCDGVPFARISCIGFGHAHLICSFAFDERRLSLIAVVGSFFSGQKPVTRLFAKPAQGLHVGLVRRCQHHDTLQLARDIHFVRLSGYQRPGRLELTRRFSSASRRTAIAQSAPPNSAC